MLEDDFRKMGLLKTKTPCISTIQRCVWTEDKIVRIFDCYKFARTKLRWIGLFLSRDLSRSIPRELRKHCQFQF